MLPIGSERKITQTASDQAKILGSAAHHEHHISSEGRAGMQRVKRQTCPISSYNAGGAFPAVLVERPSICQQTGTACRHTLESSAFIGNTASAVATHCSSGVLAPKHSCSAPPGMLVADNALLPPLPSRQGEHTSSRCLQDSSLQVGTCRAPAHQQLLQETAPAPPAIPTFSTKAFWDLTAALGEDDLGCAASACLTASAGKPQQSQYIAPAAQQLVLQSQPAVQHHQPQKHLPYSTDFQPKPSSFAASGFRRLQATPGAAMFGAVLNSLPDGSADTECSGGDHAQPVLGPRSCGFTAVLQQELQSQLGAAAASKSTDIAGSLVGPERVPAGGPALNLSHSRSQQNPSPTASARVALAAAAATAAAGGTVSNIQATELNQRQNSLAGQAHKSSVAAGKVSAAAQAAARSPGSDAVPPEGDAEQFLMACLQPGVVQALAVLVHADLLPLCCEDGSGSLVSTLAYMLTLATRSSILHSPTHPASSSSAAQAASSASDTHKLLTLLWMAESFSSQYRDSCKLVLCDYMFYPACLPAEESAVQSILQPHTQVCVQLQAAILCASSFKLWVQPEQLATACQSLLTAQGGNCLGVLQAAVQAHVCKLHEKVLQQVQEQLEAQPAGDNDPGAEQEADRALVPQQQKQAHAPAGKQPNAASAGRLQKTQQQGAQAGSSQHAPQGGQQQVADSSRAAKRPHTTAVPPPSPPQEQQQQQQRTRSQHRSAKSAASAKSAGSRHKHIAVQSRQPVNELQQIVSGRQTRSCSRNLATAALNGTQQQPAGSCVAGAVGAGILPAASAAAGKAAAVLQSTMRSAKQQILQLASSLGKRTHQQMQSVTKCGPAMP